MKKTFFSNLPIRRKITLLIMVITGTALALFTILSVITQMRQLGNNLIDNLDIISGTISSISSDSLEFSIDEKPFELLGGLEEDEGIEMGIVYNIHDEIFDMYQSRQDGGDAIIPGTIQHEGYRFVMRDGLLKIEVFHPIYKNDKRIGTLYVLSNLRKFKKQVFSSLLILVASMGIILFVVHLVTRKMQLLITKPIYNLADTARKISELGDYSVRVKRTGTDEIGHLIDDFNTMLEAIQVRDSELNQHRHNLELLIEERTEELRSRRDEALAAAQAKTEFLANMSHEIRTPMNGVIGILSLLKGASLSEEYRRLLETAVRSADSLMFIINDILDLSKIDAGMIEFEAIPFDLRALVDETVFLFIDSVDAEKIDLMSFIPNDVHCFIKGDPTRLRQVLTNLVSNAVKFTSKGEVVLQVEVVDIRESIQLLKFSVIDTGIGVPRHAKRDLFEKFTQADGSTTRKYGGTGLGLSVCKKIVEMQGGDIGVESEENNGSEFWFTLPFEMIPASNVASPCKVLDSKKILIVDDNKTNRMILEHYLNICNVFVTASGSAEKARELIERSIEQQQPFDMVLLDYHMEGEDGIQLASEISKRYPLNRPRMFLLTSGSVNNDLVRDAGIVSVIYKPIFQAHLYDVLSDRMSIKDKKAETKPKEKTTPLLSGNVLLVDDELINQKVAGAILEKFGLHIEYAVDGREAVAMNKLHHYDLILMDIQMPEMSGLEATEIIRNREEKTGGKRVTIIAMTANAMQSTRNLCLEVGMDDFISKPIKPEVLARRLRPWLSGKVQHDDHPVEEETISDTPAEHGVWDKEGALELVGNDTELLGKLIMMFLDRRAGLLQSVKDAVESADPGLLDDAAHAYKGAVSHFVADRVAAVALQLESKGKTGDLSGCRELLSELITESERLGKQLEVEISAG